MLQKLWVQHITTAKTFGPTKVSIQECSDVDDFLKEIKKESQLAITQNTPFTLYQPDGTTEIKPTDTIKSLGNIGKDADAPLVVKTTVVGTLRVPFSFFPLSTPGPLPVPLSAPGSQPVPLSAPGSQPVLLSTPGPLPV